jgi:hypothetical protein
VDLDGNVWRPQLALRLGAHLAKMDDVERQRIDDAMREAYVDLLDGDRVQLQVHARIGVGTVEKRCPARPDGRAVGGLLEYFQHSLNAVLPAWPVLWPIAKNASGWENA